MKKYIFLVFIMLCLAGSSKVWADNGSTKWEGALLVQGFELKLVFKFNQDTCLLGVPVQGVVDYPSSECQVIGDSIRVSYTGMLQAQFVGVKQADTLLVGNWLQSGKSFPLILRRKIESKRPQSPKLPLPYKQEEVSYFNHDKSIRITGTLTLPEKGNNHPVAILISGSGQQDRDESIMGHKPFLVIADYLTRQGIAVLRVDDRGVGATTGMESLKKATSYDFALDVVAGIKYLQSRSDIDQQKIGLIGHSEGGLIASIIGSKRNDLAFIVSLAGVGVSGNRLMSSQIKTALVRTLPTKSVDSIVSFEKRAMNIIIHQEDDRLAEVSISQAIIGPWLEGQDASVKEYFGMKTVDGFQTLDTKPILARYKMMMIPWFRYFIAYQPDEFLPKVKAPFLVLNGEKDTQVLADLNTLGFKRIFDACGKTNYKIKTYPNLNHFFQHCETGYIDEVEAIEETISEEVLNDMSVWIEEQLGKKN
ncbi:alpha/beta hydrolase [Ancylomarina euxinus]|uniref:Alpha/beta hydrolase n=1 Tax=Ancylomarina euxinus TaxID=2283627 RepID=A0A425XXU2_9BACT|nr:prolyl oligopeptidase family serine peptidase [Ancylomarina euxinus]MCZ4696037.1 prolyl oligopeptidase family serine peptidase [Ancylomarina euxinus]MUP13976.1 prolyl oligopeptidase family serine peptidase [Ancylomarina euxinus]RRG19530.1 alpha/beta hydrolase [Ancylomarina euxinus]